MHYEETVYQSHYDWMIGALAIILVAFCSIVPTFVDWWHLGRTVSMSPIETAKAFDAPLLWQADPNGTAHDISVQLRSVNIQYGASIPLNGEDQDENADHAKGSSTDGNLNNNAAAFARGGLHFSAEGTVTRPRYGQTFDTTGPDFLGDHRVSAYSGATYVNSP